MLGSNSTTSSIYGIAVGADYRFSPATIAGFALAGGGTNFNVANGGSGRSDLFQAGAFIRHDAGAAYLSGALAYGWQDITTNRTVTIAGVDRLRAKFNANAWSGRVEGGYRFVAPGLADRHHALRRRPVHHFELPAYAEQAVVGANTFALAYAAKSVTASRSELGLRTDKSFAMLDGVLTLRGRAAWAHDYNTDRASARHSRRCLAHLRRQRRRAGPGRRTRHLIRRKEMDQRLVGRRAPSRASSPTSPPAMPARASCATRGREGVRLVGWVERSETHHLRAPRLKGFARAQPILRRCVAAFASEIFTRPCDKPARRAKHFRLSEIMSSPKIRNKSLAISENPK